MSRFARWFDRAFGSSRSSQNRRRRKPNLRARRLHIESLENRQLLAYNVTETGSAGNETLVISKALADTANLTLTSDSAGDLTISDPGNTFSGGPFTGVTIGANSVTVNAATAGVVHLVFDLSSTNSNTQNLTVGNLNGATIPGFDVVQNQSGATVFNDVTVTLATATINTGSSTAANASINLGSLYNVVVDAPSVTIKTAQLATDAPGSVNLGYVSAAAAGDNLSIDTSTSTAGVDGGDVSFAALTNIGGSYVNDFSVNTTGASSADAGTMSFGQSAMLIAPPGSLGPYETTGTQTYDGFVVIEEGDITFASAGHDAVTFEGQVLFTNGDPTDLGAGGDFTLAATGPVTFGSTVNLVQGSLTINTPGLTTFDGVVGGLASSPNVESLDVSGPVDIGANIYTVFQQTYGGPVTLSTNSTLVSVGNGSTNFSPGVTFDSTVDATGGAGLSINTPGLTTFDGVVGGSASSPDLDHLYVSGPAQIGASISTLGAQTYGGPVTLAASVTLTTTEVLATPSLLPYSPAVGILFNSSVDGAFNLIADSPAAIDFTGAVGSSTPLTSITTSNIPDETPGLVEIGAPTITTGTQTYNQPVELASTGSISEGVNLTAGTYEVQLQAAQGNDTGAPQSLQFSVDGTLAGSVTPTGPSYATYNSDPFVAASGTNRLITASSPAGSGNAVLLEDLTFQPVDAGEIPQQDFSVSSVGNGTWQYDPAGSPWTFNGTAGVSGNNSGITAGNGPAPQGSQVAFVQNTGSMSETVNMTAGTYTLDFLAAQRQNYNHGGQSLEVLVDGVQVGSSITPSGSSYALYGSASFTLTTGAHTIEILGLDPSGGDNTALLDGLSIQPAATNQVADGNFNSPTIASGHWQYGPTTSAWYFQGTAGISGSYSGITAGNPGNPGGDQVGFVQGTGSISQVIVMSAGTYNLDFYAAQRANYNHGGQSLEVLVDGVAIGPSITPSSASYALYGSGAFTVSAGPHTIEILGLDPNGQDNTALISGVALTTPVVPTGVSDFSLPAIGPGTWQYGPTGSTWSFSGMAGVSANYSGITAGNPVAPLGSQVAFVQDTGSMTETMNMSAGSYTLNFQAAQRENYNHGGQTLEVLIDGVAVAGTIAPAGSSYAEYSSAAFSVTAGIHTITIEGLDPSGQDNTALIDSITVEPVVTTQSDNLGLSGGGGEMTLTSGAIQGTLTVTAPSYNTSNAYLLGSLYPAQLSTTGLTLGELSSIATTTGSGFVEDTPTTLIINPATVVIPSTGKSSTTT